MNEMNAVELANLVIEYELLSQKPRPVKTWADITRRVDIYSKVNTAAPILAARVLDLEAENARLRAALEPFSRFAQAWDELSDSSPDDKAIAWARITFSILEDDAPADVGVELGDFRAARAALAPKGDDNEA